MARNTLVPADKNAPPITRLLAEHVASHPSKGWDDAVDHEAHRTFLNWMGCAIGAAHHETARKTIEAVNELQPAPQASILGRQEKVDMASAALINGITSHTFDFDDTHLKTIIHPASPVIPALLALAEHRAMTGREVIDAMILGIDVACRMGNLVYPEHYDRGWHITGTTGTLGAAAGCARLLKLDAYQTQMALGIAASQPVGLREQFGTMTKPFHPGGAARAGLLSALLAAKGFTASERALEAPRGWAQVISTKTAWHEATDELSHRFEISFNSYKPFACGIVIHPCIDACIQLREQGIHPEQIERIELKVHPLVLELTGKKEPQDGLQAKFSVYHSCAVGLMFGRADESEYQDDVVNRDDLITLRRKVVAVADGAIGEASTDATAYLKDGSQVHVFVEHAIGSVARPLTDTMLEEKFTRLTHPILGQKRCAQLIETCWKLGSLPEIGALTALAQP